MLSASVFKKCQYTEKEKKKVITHITKDLDFF